MTTGTIFAALPFILVFGLIVSRRADVLTAGAVGWLFAVAEAVTGFLPRRLDISTATIECLKGSWLAWQSAIVIFGGFFFYLAVRRREALLAGTTIPHAFSYRRLWTICFLLGPAVESATGFGVGAVAAFAAIQRMGICRTPAVVLALYSQMLVPWGALAVGTIIGSALAKVEPALLSFASAVLTAPLLAGYLVLYWYFAGCAGHRVPFRQKIDDVAWTLILMLCLGTSAALAEVELGAIVPTGILLMLRWWRDERPTFRRTMELCSYVAPYFALTGALLLTRSLPPLKRLLQSFATIAPFPDLPDYPVFYNPSFWLFAIAIWVLVANRLAEEIPSAIAETARRAWRPIALTLVFLAMAQVLSGAGAAAAIGTALSSALGIYAQIVAPLIGGLAGLLIGSNSASTGMMMPVQTALGINSSLWPAALQNTSASNFTLLSPSRVGVAVALATMHGQEARIYRLIWPIGVMLAGLLTVEAVLIMCLG